MSPSAAPAGALRVDGVSRAFGGVFAVKEVSLDVGEGEVRGIIGANGAGKSTLFNLISGHLVPDEGTVTYRGHRIESEAPHRRANRGIAIVFQGARIFRGMTVLENVMVGGHASTNSGFLSSALRIPVQRREEHMIRDRAHESLGRVGLTDWEQLPAESLPLGQQRRLQVARALCAEPTLLLLDEPASGLRSGERSDLAELVEHLHGEGLTMLLIEHDVAFVVRLADRVTVLDLGAVIAEGTPAEVTSNPRVVEAYLGQGAASAAG